MLDYSKNRIHGSDSAALDSATSADECGLRERIDAMFRGDKINSTEGGAWFAYQHCARARPNRWLRARNPEVRGEPVHQSLEHMAEFANQVRGGSC